MLSLLDLKRQASRSNTQGTRAEFRGPNLAHPEFSHALTQHKRRRGAEGCATVTPGLVGRGDRAADDVPQL